MKRAPLSIASSIVLSLLGAPHAANAQTSGAIILDPNKPARASREICNPADPIVAWDAVFSTQQDGLGCKSFTPADAVPGLKFAVVQGEKHSLTIRYAEAHPPLITPIYEKMVDGTPQRCVTVSMPDGMMLQSRARAIESPAAAPEELNRGLILSCMTASCHWGNGTCCCSGDSCYCFICTCRWGCPDCTCESEDGGFWPARHGGGGDPTLPGNDGGRRVHTIDPSFPE